MSQRQDRGVGKPEFGVVIAQQNLAYGQIREIAVEAERDGFDSIWLYDHLFWSREPFLECWTTLSSLAVESRRPRVGTLVTCYSYRFPSLLAKMAATLDNISEGRLTLGVGSGTSLGYHEHEVKSYGFSFPQPSIRIDQLREYIEVIKQMWNSEESHYNGKFYKTEGAICFPKPFQKTGPPIMVAGSGDRFLKLAVDLADEYNYWGSIHEFSKRIATLNELCRSSGRDPESLRKSWHISGVIDRDVNRLRERLKYYEERDIIKEPRFGGTPEDWVRLLGDYIAIGVSSFQIWFLEQASLKALRLFADEVMPKLKTIER